MDNKALNAYKEFSDKILPETLNELYPGCAKNFWMQGAISFVSEVPIIVTSDIINDSTAKTTLLRELANIFKVDLAKVKMTDTDVYKVYNDVISSSGYRSYKSVTRWIYTVDWHDTKEEHLVEYRDYIRSSMKSQGIQWEKQLLEKINESTREAFEKYVYNKFLYNNFGISKMTEYIAGIVVGPDYLDIAFDFMPKETVVMNGLSGKPSKLLHPTPTEIEVTEKRIDRVICEQLVEEFFSDMNRTPFFKLVPAGHVELIDNKSLGCLYNIVQFNERM